MATGARSFASSASLLVGLQLCSRLFTFTLNQALLRFVSPRALGTASIQFELLSSTILFLSREGFRNALIRAWNDHQKHEKDPSSVPPRIANLTLVPTMLGAPTAIIASCVYRAACSQDTRMQPYFDHAVFIYALAACIELCSEPMHIKTMGELRTGVRVRAEGLGVVAKTTATFTVLLWESRSLGEHGTLALPAFAVGQLAYAVVVLSSYLIAYGHEPLRLHRLPGQLSHSFDSQYLRLSVSMTMQSVFKHLLTEGDKFLVSRISPLEDQGAYALASNYGSLVARILFQPVEEMSRVYFSKTLPQHASTLPEKQPSTSERRTALGQSARVLTSVLAVQTAASILLWSFAPPFLPLLLALALPARYMDTSAPQLLSAWIWYIPVLALNGVLEAFVASASAPRDIHRQSRWMAGFSVVFVLATGLFYGFGFRDVSLIYANIANLVSRMLFAAHFISSYFREQHTGNLILWSPMVPTGAFIIGAMGSGAVVRAYASHYAVVDIIRVNGRSAVLKSVVLQHISLGSALAVACASIWWVQTGQRLSLSSQKKD